MVATAKTGDVRRRGRRHPPLSDAILAGDRELEQQALLVLRSAGINPASEVLDPRRLVREVPQ